MPSESDAVSWPSRHQERRHGHWPQGGDSSVALVEVILVILESPCLYEEVSVSCYTDLQHITDCSTSPVRAWRAAFTTFGQSWERPESPGAPTSTPRLSRRRFMYNGYSPLIFVLPLMDQGYTLAPRLSVWREFEKNNRSWPGTLLM